MAETTCDFVWLNGLATELRGGCTGRKLTLFRHQKRPLCLIDAGGDRSWVADMTPGASHVRQERPERREDWRQWGGARTDGAELETIRVRGGDRVLSLNLVRKSRVGDTDRTELVWEFGGLLTNAVLITGAGVVLDVFRPVSARVNRFRTVLIGRQYGAPPTGGRIRLDEPWEWDVRADRTLKEFLTGGFLASGRHLAEELLTRCALRADTPTAECSTDAKAALESAFKSMVEAPEPCVLLDETGVPFDYLGFAPSMEIAGSWEPVPSFCEAAGRVWSIRRERDKDDERVLGALAARRGELKRLVRQRDHLLDDRAQAARADDLKQLADTIMANLAQIPDGAQEITIRDWFDADGGSVVIRLDPTRTPSAQAQQLYTRARKLRESIPHLEQRLSKTERMIARLEQQIRETEETLSAARLARSMGYRVPQTPKDTEGKSPHYDGIRPRRYRTREGGWLVLVGRNDDENDTLSLKVAAADDLWFHAQGCPGSHVVLKKEGRKEEPSRQAIAEAAAVAAYWSKARGSSKVGVSYTRAKHVTKPKGSPSGTVTIRQEKLITVPPALLPMEDSIKETDT